MLGPLVGPADNSFDAFEHNLIQEVIDNHTDDEDKCNRYNCEYRSDE